MKHEAGEIVALETDEQRALGVRAWIEYGVSIRGDAACTGYIAVWGSRPRTITGTACGHVDRVIAQTRDAAASAAADIQADIDERAEKRAKQLEALGAARVARNRDILSDDWVQVVTGS